VSTGDERDGAGSRAKWAVIVHPEPVSGRKDLRFYEGAGPSGMYPSGCWCRCKIRSLHCRRNRSGVWLEGHRVKSIVA